MTCKINVLINILILIIIIMLSVLTTTRKAEIVVYTVSWAKTRDMES